MSSNTAAASEPKGFKKFLATIEKKMAKLNSKKEKKAAAPKAAPAPKAAATPAPAPIAKVEEPIATAPAPAPAPVAVAEEAKPEAAPAAPTKVSHTFTRTEAPESTVQVAGTFSNWEPVALTYDAQSNAFKQEMELEAGQSYEYKFIVNGNWICDHELPTVENDGNVNNALAL